MDLSDRDLHGALLDSRLLAEVYLELKGGKQFSMNLSKNNNLSFDNNTNKEKIKPKLKKLLNSLLQKKI